MSSTPKKPRTKRKPPKGRPSATSTLTQPVVQDSSSITSLFAFSPNGNLFAFISLAVDKHRLRVYDTGSGKAVADHVVDTGRITALAWSCFDPSDEQRQAVKDGSDLPSKKKRKKHKIVVSEASEADAQIPSIEVVVLGVSDGTVLLFSPSHGRIVRKLSHSTSTAAIMSVVMMQLANSNSTVWTSGADGAIRLWNALKNDMLGSWKYDNRIPYSSMAVRPESSTEEGRVEIVLANHSIRLLSVTSGFSAVNDFETHKPVELATFSGHASSVTRLQWDASQKPSKRLLSMAEADRLVYVWEVPTIQAGHFAEGKIVASIPLDSDARSISLSLSTSMSTEKQTILTLSASGKISIYPLPLELATPASSNKTQHSVPTLLPRSNVTITTKKCASAMQVIDAVFASGEEGRIRVARLVGGVKPVFSLIDYLDETKNFIQDVNVVQDDSAWGLHTHSATAVANKRYTESSSLAVHSGIELGQDQDMDDLTVRDVEGNLDVDLAELSLGQRLTAISGRDEGLLGTSSDNDEKGTSNPSKSKSTSKKEKEKKKQHELPVAVPANSLTRTLIQALHSSDSGLLETCLAHSDQTLIQNTVRRLPPQLALPLITACVDRLGRGARVGNMKGGGAGASSQRGSGLVKWVKSVLAVHSGHLMTMPDVVARLSGLHATLTSRLALQESLLSLSGRLDMVLSQIEMRSSTAPAPLALRKGKGAANGPMNEVRRYVEGESEEEPMNVEVEMENGDEGDSIEDVELGGDSEDEDSAEMSEDEDSDIGDDSEVGGPTPNCFIDDEAEDEEDDEDEDESE